MGRWTATVDAGLYWRQQRPVGAALALQWLGTAGFRVVYGGTPAGAGEHHVWLDPHLSRHSLWEIATTRLAPKIERITAEVDRADAVVVGHSHFDHALDAPAIAGRFGARLYGGETTMHIARGQGLDGGLLRQLEPGVTVADGPCRLTAWRSQHSKFAMGRVPAPGGLTAPLAQPARAEAFRVGDVYVLHLAGAPLTVAHVGSADLIEAELEGVQADVVLACTVGRHATERFVERLVDALRPRMVVPCHWDRFWRPLDETPLQIPGNDLAGFVEEVRRHRLRPEVRVLPPRGWLTLA